MPNLLRGIGGAARRVDAQYDSLDVIVIGQLLQVLVYLVANNLMTATHEHTLSGCIDNVAISIVDGNLFAVVLLLHVLHVADAQLLDTLFVVEFEELLHFCLHLVVEEQTVDKLEFLQCFRTFKDDQSVGIGVQRVDADLATLADSFHHVSPEAVDVGLRLLAVGVAHAVLGVHLGGTLILTHLDDLHLDAYLGQQILDEHGLRSDAVPVESATRVQPHLVGHRTEIVGTLCVGVGICDHPLASLLKVEECVAHFLQRGIVGRKASCLNINAFHVVVVLSLADGLQRLV